MSKNVNNIQMPQDYVDRALVKKRLAVLNVNVHSVKFSIKDKELVTTIVWFFFLLLIKNIILIGIGLCPPTIGCGVGGTCDKEKGCICKKKKPFMLVEYCFN
jgi:hypothetical protein